VAALTNASRAAHWSPPVHCTMNTATIPVFGLTDRSVPPVRRTPVSESQPGPVDLFEPVVQVDPAQVEEFVTVPHLVETALSNHTVPELR
jgi:hypothetical protein